MIGTCQRQERKGTGSGRAGHGRWEDWPPHPPPTLLVPFNLQEMFCLQKYNYSMCINEYTEKYQYHRLLYVLVTWSNFIVLGFFSFRFLQIGTDPKEARYWLRQFQQNESAPDKPFAVVQVDSRIMEDKLMVSWIKTSMILFSLMSWRHHLMYFDLKLLWFFFNSVTLLPYS